jgi:hypothetical protein
MVAISREEQRGRVANLDCRGSETWLVRCAAAHGCIDPGGGAPRGAPRGKAPTVQRRVRRSRHHRLEAGLMISNSTFGVPRTLLIRRHGADAELADGVGIQLRPGPHLAAGGRGGRGDRRSRRSKR